MLSNSGAEGGRKTTRRGGNRGERRAAAKQDKQASEKSAFYGKIPRKMQFLARSPAALTRIPNVFSGDSRWRGRRKNFAFLSKKGEKNAAKNYARSSH